MITPSSTTAYLETQYNETYQKFTKEEPGVCKIVLKSTNDSTPFVIVSDTCHRSFKEKIGRVVLHCIRSIAKYFQFSYDKYDLSLQLKNIYSLFSEDPILPSSPLSDYINQISLDHYQRLTNVILNTKTLSNMDQEAIMRELDQLTSNVPASLACALADSLASISQCDHLSLLSRQFVVRGLMNIEQKHSQPGIIDALQKAMLNPDPQFISSTICGMAAIRLNHCLNKEDKRNFLKQLSPAALQSFGSWIRL